MDDNSTTKTTTDPPWFCPQCGKLKGECQHAEAALALLGMVEQFIGDNIHVPCRPGSMNKGNQVLAAIKGVANYLNAREPANTALANLTCLVIPAGPDGVVPDGAVQDVANHVVADDMPDNLDRLETELEQNLPSG